jgi:signal transduction histidine kinase
MIGRVRNELGTVIDELRDLARGIHPAVLSQVGLEQAIRSLAEQYTIPVDVRLPEGRFDEAAELTAYFVIAESVTNAIKHAAASRISIRGDKGGGLLRITIADDGRGGASTGGGTGISGLIDRVRGTGGDIEIDSPPGQGTRIRLVLPCA